MRVQDKAWNRVETFLTRGSFIGFTIDDLFIKRFVPKGWGQDIAALSNMAEAINLRHQIGLLDNESASDLIRATTVGCD